VGILVATVVRFFAYRFLVFNQELDQEPEFSHDHEIIEVHHHSAQPAERVLEPDVEDPQRPVRPS
jgi:hypothetical protein